jgi:hypothetical protein
MRRGEAPAAVAEETCVLGHAWQGGRVLCPVCGFGRRVTPADGEAEQVTVTAVVAMPAARAGEVTSNTVSPDGKWAWDGDEWVPASMSTIAASATVAAGTAEVPAARTAVELTDEDTSTWAPRDTPRSLPRREVDRGHGPRYDDSAPAPIPMPFDAVDEPAVPKPVDAVAAQHDADTLEDLARLLAMGDVADEEQPDVVAAATDTSYVAPGEPAIAPGSTPIDVAPLEVTPPEVVPVEPAERSAPVEAVAARPSTIASITPISIVLLPSAPADVADEPGDPEPASRRTLRLSRPQRHPSPNGLRAAVVVIVAAVSTVIATGHSPFAHHAAAAPRVDTLLQSTLRDVATLETRYAGEHGTAGLSAATLTPGGYRAPSLVSLSVARTSGRGFCVVGSGPVAGTHAYELWESARGGLVSTDGTAVAFPTPEAAQVACHGAGGFLPL